jgi:hypothetical protein
MKFTVSDFVGRDFVILYLLFYIGKRFCDRVDMDIPISNQFHIDYELDV